MSIDIDALVMCIPQPCFPLPAAILDMSMPFIDMDPFAPSVGDPWSVLFAVVDGADSLDVLPIDMPGMFGLI